MTTAAAAARDKHGPRTGADYAALMNRSAFTPNQPRRKCLPSAEAMSGVRKFCETDFACEDALGATIYERGVVRARMISGEGDWQVFDRLKRPAKWAKLCMQCSSRLLRPVYHKNDGSACSRLLASQSRGDEEHALLSNLASPDAKRSDFGGTAG